jgi:hypothetical protein
LLDITRDEDFCGPFKLKDESLVVDPESHGIRYVAVWIDSRDEVPVHPDLQSLPGKPPVLDNRNCRFEPHMMAVRTGQEFQIANSDEIAHNAAVYVRRNQPFSIVIDQSQPLVRSFQKPESFPVRVECSIHAWMRAYLLICDHPYAVVTDADGRFELRNVPAGDWQLHFWHERPGHLKSLTLNGRTETLDRGRLSITVTGGEETKLGTIKVPGADFREDG